MFLQLDHVTIRYPGSASQHPAVDQVSLTLNAGEIGVLIGPSGCGKTSLLRAIAGLERIQGGRILIAGQVLSAATPDATVHLAPERRQIGMVFQDYALFPHLNVHDNVAFGLPKMDKAQRSARVAQMLALVGLAGMERRYAHQLSGGQQQRVALARALAPQPRLLLLDEPFSNLDVDLRERLAHELRNILKQTSTTALFVTHDQMEAFAVGDLIGVMNHGRLEQWDDAYHLYHRPATRFVADFIGHGVFAPARIVESVHGPVVRTPLGDLTDLEECPLPTAYPDGECEVLLRADDIVHDDASPVKARIERKAFRGSEFLYTLRLESGEQVLAHVPSHHDHALGEWIGIRPDVDHVVTFPKETAG
ncbi:ABC transporter ATP-binding protein [Caldimonas thermodepolymerans]|jgi:iron(III) transport system ATP-binding protein|uniref:ABC transporter ATP-binding protein n=1 Tax=Caldimonas thermodepolymerans TaxID=215580 RepID=A0A2S5T953_9BURK|nr:ABC transporter ATP-binding protein [Caldimonas thermodepolymerans]PPE71398.1 ABC transporter ATP-binding protein [Caldimonas thermodepolymerans]QPC32573.1 ABC transporter ATP-binding protein [Caldimonas thermodepolymerans]RDH98972.1 iron(III) transport system ATP-binding protein [Caldimonas thermodepolymerans]TCP06371.1 iron(III) transport system ATP-binding protein [Caldimonas thermodepolymerans]UZG45376.1 ABC transporter ATP-binding protein [Caldimonas thermodepolymerans]